MTVVTRTILIANIVAFAIVTISPKVAVTTFLLSLSQDVLRYGPKKPEAKISSPEPKPKALDNYSTYL